MKCNIEITLINHICSQLSAVSDYNYIDILQVRNAQTDQAYNNHSKLYTVKHYFLMHLNFAILECRIFAHGHIKTSTKNAPYLSKYPHVPQLIAPLCPPG